MKRSTALLTVLAIAAWAAFFQIADLMLSGRAESWNIAIMQGVPLWHAPWLHALAIGVTQCGSEVGLTAIGLVTVILMGRQGHRQDAGLVALLLIGTAFWTYGLKAVYQHPRPQVFAHVVAETGFSFPSGHALAGWSFFGFLAIWSLLQGKRSLALLAGLLAILVPLSRLYLGVHWPTDVLAGFCMGTFWLSLCFALRQHLRPEPVPDRP